MGKEWEWENIWINNIYESILCDVCEVWFLYLICEFLNLETIFFFFRKKKFATVCWESQFPLFFHTHTQQRQKYTKKNCSHFLWMVSFFTKFSNKVLNSWTLQNRIHAELLNKLKGQSGTFCFTNGTNRAHPLCWMGWRISTF